MLLHSLLLTILMPVALGAPVSKGSTPPTLSLVSTTSHVLNATDSLSESGVHRANKAALHLPGNRGAGTPSFDAHSALGTHVSLGRGHLGWDLGLNRANRMNDDYRGERSLGGSETSWHAAQGTGARSGDALGGSSGGTVGGASDGDPRGVEGTTGSHSAT